MLAQLVGVNTGYSKAVDLKSGSRSADRAETSRTHQRNRCAYRILGSSLAYPEGGLPDQRHGIRGRKNVGGEA